MNVEMSEGVYSNLNREKENNVLLVSIIIRNNNFLRLFEVIFYNKYEIYFVK